MTEKSEKSILRKEADGMKNIRWSILNMLSSAESYYNEYESESITRMAVCRASVYPEKSGILQHLSVS